MILLSLQLCHPLLLMSYLVSTNPTMQILVANQPNADADILSSSLASVAHIGMIVESSFNLNSAGKVKN